MRKIAIVTDSTSDLPKDIVENYHIHVIPLHIKTTQGVLADGVDLNNEEYYELLKREASIPKTSQISPALFMECYENLIHQGFDTIFSIHISAELSGTVNSAKLAAKEFVDKADIFIYDSRSATLGLGLLVYSFAKYAKDVDEIEKLDMFLKDRISRLRIYFLLDDLEHLEKGGRIGKASYMVGSLLNIKPLLVLSDGVISVHKKIRGNKDNKAIQELAKSVLQDRNSEFAQELVLGYNDKKELLEALETKLLGSLENHSYGVYRLGSVVSTHIGLGAVGVAFFA